MGACAALLRRRIDRSLDLFAQAALRLLVDDAVGLQLGAEQHRSDRAPCHRSSSPSGPILGRIGPRMTAEAIGLGLDQRRPIAGARASERLGHDPVDGVDILAVDDYPGDRVRRGAVGEIVDRRRLAIGLYSP